MTFQEFWERFSKNKFAVVGLVVLLMIFFVAIFAPFIAPYPPNSFDPARALLPPSANHWMGTDALGGDVFSRLVFGARVSLEVGFVAVAIYITIGTVLGAIAGYFGGLVDAVIMRLVDIMMAFPTLFLILAVIAFLRPSIFNIMVVIGLTSWPGVARLVRAEVLSLRERDFVIAARLQGASHLRVIFRHILPNALGPVLVAATLGVAGAILVESSLSFLGIGVQPPTPSWGNMLLQGKEHLESAWWLSVFPGLAILITVLAFNLVGEGLREAFNPKNE